MSSMAALSCVETTDRGDCDVLKALAVAMRLAAMTAFMVVRVCVQLMKDCVAMFTALLTASVA